MRRLFGVVISLWLGSLSATAENVPAQVSAAQMPVLDHALTLPELLSLLHSRNPTLAAGRAHVEAIRDQEITARLRPNPVFTSANEDFSPSHFTRSYVTTQQEFTDSVSQLIERGKKRQRRLEDARLGTTVAQDTFPDNERLLDF